MPEPQYPIPGLLTIPRAGRRALNLLALVDPKLDTKAGSWALEPGGLAVQSGDDSRIRLPYRPPDEYDFRITFTRQGGNECVMAMPARSRAFVPLAHGRLGKHDLRLWHYRQGRR